jgi:hypothetical protein
LESHIGGGGGFVGIHPAADTEYAARRNQDCCGLGCRKLRTVDADCCGAPGRASNSCVRRYRWQLPLISNRAAIGAWETFTLIRHSDGAVSFVAAANGKYVTAEEAGAEPLIANRTAIGVCETFDLIGA